MKSLQHFFNGIAMYCKGCFKAFMFTVMKSEKINKIKQIGSIECAVFEL
jgi:hypothetical protein